MSKFTIPAYFSWRNQMREEFEKALTALNSAHRLVTAKAHFLYINHIARKDRITTCLITGETRTIKNKL